MTAVLIAAAVTFIALVVLLTAVTVPGGPEASPSPTASAQASPSPPTPSPSPVTPLTLSEAVEAFKDLVETGEEEGLIDQDAAGELGDRADDLASALDEGTQGDVNKSFRDLRRAIDGFEEDGQVVSSMADRLREAVDDIEAAAARGVTD